MRWGLTGKSPTCVPVSRTSYTQRWIARTAIRARVTMGSHEREIRVPPPSFRFTRARGTGQLITPLERVIMALEAHGASAHIILAFLTEWTRWWF